MGSTSGTRNTSLEELAEARRAEREAKAARVAARKAARAQAKQQQQQQQSQQSSLGDFVPDDGAACRKLTAVERKAAKRAAKKRRRQAATTGGEKARASHILLGDAVVLRRVADKLSGQGRAEFAAMAQRLSSCPSGKKGGDLGWFAPGKMVPEFDEVVFGGRLQKAAALGAVVGPVKTTFGHHLIMVTERRSKEDASIGPSTGQPRTAKRKVSGGVAAVRGGTGREKGKQSHDVGSGRGSRTAHRAGGQSKSSSGKISREELDQYRQGHVEREGEPGVCISYTVHCD
jgi:peptidyl-prolyl cis-trans isomerase C